MESRILELFKANRMALLNYKQVSAKLAYEGDRNDIIAALANLAKEDRLGEHERGKYFFLQKQLELEGRLEITSKGTGYVITDDEDAEDIFIEPYDLNKAFHGDRVLVKVRSKGKGRKLEGKVISILQRSQKQFVGTFEMFRAVAFVVPDDKKMYTDIFIPAKEINGATHGQKVIVEISEWPDETKNPFGKIIQILGMPGENNAEMHAIVTEFGFPISFPPEVLLETDAISTTISEEEIAKRNDLREEPTFTIDPHDAKDFDDAISIQQLSENRYKVGVHIADVSHYIPLNSALDLEAFNRGTSVYLVDRTIPMLPEKLSNMVCSLRPNEEKLCFTILFELNEKGEVLDEWIGKSVINSNHRFAYEEAQEILEGKEGPFQDELLTLNSIAKNLRDERFRKGAISFETEEVKFRLDAEGKPLEVYKKERKDAHKLVEEFMLLANRRVAEWVNRDKKSSRKGSGEKAEKVFVYRVHDTPGTDKLMEFNQFIARFGYKMKYNSDREISSAFNKLLDEVEGKPEQNILQSMAIRTMAKALYTTHNKGHYGLAFDFYSHFTSPIRRYPDLMVHRLLDRYLQGKALPKGLDPNIIEQQCKHASIRESKAAEAERASVKYKQAEYLQQYIGKTFDGIISGVTDWGIFVEIIENKCEGMIRLNALYDDFYEYDEKAKAVVGKRFRKRYSMGDPVKVLVKKADPLKRTIDFNIVSNKKRF